MKNTEGGGSHEPGNKMLRGIKRRLKRILTPKIDIYKEYKSAVKNWEGR